MNATRPSWWRVNIGLRNGLVPSGNKPLPELMLTQIYVAKWRQQASMSWIYKFNEDGQLPLNELLSYTIPYILRLSESHTKPFIYNFPSFAIQAIRYLFQSGSQWMPEHWCDSCQFSFPFAMLFPIRSVPGVAYRPFFCSLWCSLDIIYFTWFL